MFLEVLRRRNPGFVEAAIALHREGRLPANSYVLDLDAVEANARALTGGGGPARGQGLRHDQAGRTIERLLPGGAARRHRALGGGRYGLRAGDASRRAAGRPSRASDAGATRRGGGRGCGVPARLLDGLQRRPRRARPAPRPRLRVTSSRCWRASARMATPSTADTRAASTPPRWLRWRMRWTRCPAGASPGSPRFQPCSLTPRPAR